MLGSHISLGTKVSVDVHDDGGEQGKEETKSNHDGVTNGFAERWLASKVRIFSTMVIKRRLLIQRPLDAAKGIRHDGDRSRHMRNGNNKIKSRNDFNFYFFEFVFDKMR